MPRRYYSRRTRIIRPKKKWASNISMYNLRIEPNDTQGGATPLTALVTNAAQGNSPTPTILKCGNFKINADLYYGAGSTPITPATNYHLVAFIIFLPEGISPTNNAQLGNLINSHPEYIMAWKQLEAGMTFTSTNSATQKVVFSSRLKRNLNSGDRVAFAVLDQTPSSNLNLINVNFTAQYWTCAN